MTCNLSMLKWLSVISESTECKCWNTSFNLFIQNNACSKYWSVFSLWEMYCVSITKFITAQMKCTAADAQYARSETITDIIWCTMTLQSSSVHCFMLLYHWKSFKSVNAETEQNWLSSCVISEALKILCLTPFFFLVAVMLSSISCSNQQIK